MCIFTQPVISVDNTKIFARLSGKGTQFLAYQMDYKSNEPNAMVLPIPIRQPAAPDFLRFIDLKNYGEFFDDLANGFPWESRGGIGCSAEFADKSVAAALQVFEVGNYIASFVPTLSDFDRLDSQFKLPDETWAKIPGYENFGFAVFQLAAGSLKPHPMAFEFQTSNGGLFFPTVHIHDGEVHDAEHFDHALYMQHAGLDSKVQGYRNSNIEDKSTGLVRSKHAASQFCNVDAAPGMIEADLLVHRKILRGELPNTDTAISPLGDPVTPSFNFRKIFYSYVPLAVALGTIGWFFNRRSKLKNRKAEFDTSIQ